MPTIVHIDKIDISIKKFLDNCSREELIELDLLIQTPFYRMRMEEVQETEEITVKSLNE
nr:hypothetical protein [uncultured Draconibacterium sp.]